MNLLMTEEVDKDNVREMVFAAVFKGDDVMTVYLFAIEEGVPTVIAEIVLTMSKGLVLGRQVGCFASVALLPVHVRAANRFTMQNGLRPSQPRQLACQCSDPLGRTAERVA